jgi:hypothetical protein
MREREREVEYRGRKKKGKRNADHLSTPTPISQHAHENIRCGTNQRQESRYNNNE